jgi:hypothetical protein
MRKATARAMPAKTAGGEQKIGVMTKQAVSVQRSMQCPLATRRLVSRGATPCLIQTDPLPKMMHYKLASAAGANIQNEPGNDIQNDGGCQKQNRR